MNREGKVFFQDKLAGKVWQDDTSYGFVYDQAWLANRTAQPVSLTLPLRAEPYYSDTMIPFFDGLIPEGWLLEITVKNWKLDPSDRMGLLLAVCKDCLGAISVEGIETKENT
jgi:serine/threonine-protein kinase HipA